MYYDYGTNLYYEGDSVYYNDQVVATADEYSQQAQAIATNLPDVNPDQVDWMPLGVFALAQKDGSVEDSTLFVQLAISKEGIIAGSFQNTATNNAFELEGTIDQKTQRAAWGPVGESWPIMETGVYNLTENELGGVNSLRRWPDTAMDDDAIGRANRGHRRVLSGALVRSRDWRNLALDRCSER